jgi:hypothetical protein
VRRRIRERRHLRWPLLRRGEDPLGLRRREDEVGRVGQRQRRPRNRRDGGRAPLRRRGPREARPGRDHGPPVRRRHGEARSGARRGHARRRDPWAERAVRLHGCAVGELRELPSFDHRLRRQRPARAVRRPQRSREREQGEAALVHQRAVVAVPGRHRRDAPHYAGDHRLPPAALEPLRPAVAKLRSARQRARISAPAVIPPHPGCARISVR